MMKPPPSPTSEPKMLAPTPIAKSSAKSAAFSLLLVLDAPDIAPVARIDFYHVTWIDE